METEAAANPEKDLASLIDEALIDEALSLSKYLCLLFLAIRHLNDKVPLPKEFEGYPPPFSIHSDGARFGVTFIRDVIWDSRQEPIAFEPENTLVERLITHIMKNVMAGFAKTVDHKDLIKFIMPDQKEE